MVIVNQMIRIDLYSSKYIERHFCWRRDRITDRFVNREYLFANDSTCASSRDRTRTDERSPQGHERSTRAWRCHDRLIRDYRTAIATSLVYQSVRIADVGSLSILTSLITLPVVMSLDGGKRGSRSVDRDRRPL